MLLTLLKIDQDLDEALEAVIHLWYSVKLQSSHLHQLQLSIGPLFQEVCAKVKDKPDDALLAKTWTFGAKSLRVILSNDKWMLLPTFLEVLDGLSCNQADKIRKDITLAERLSGPEHLHAKTSSSCASRGSAKMEFCCPLLSLAKHSTLLTRKVSLDTTYDVI